MLVSPFLRWFWPVVWKVRYESSPRHRLPRTRAQTGKETQFHSTAISIAVAHSPRYCWEQIESRAEHLRKNHILVQSGHVWDAQVLV